MSRSLREYGTVLFCAFFMNFVLAFSVIADGERGSNTEVEVLSQLRDLTEKFMYQEAYALSLQLRVKFEGDPRFDFYYGMAAVEVGAASEGSLALERVLLHAPDNSRIRLEYARSLFILGNNEAAKAEFEKVLSKNEQLPQSVKDKVDTYIAQINYRQRDYYPSWKLTTQLVAGYDSNINSTPDDQLQKVQLSQSSLGRPDNFSELKLGTHYNYPFDARKSIFLKTDFSQHSNLSTRGFDSRNLLLQTGWVYKNVDNGSRWQAVLALNHIESDYDAYRNTVSVSADWSRNIGGDIAIGANTSVSQHHHYSSTLSWRDSWLCNVGVNGYWIFPRAWKTPVLFTNFFYGIERPEVQTVVSSASVEKMNYGAVLGAQIAVNPEQSAVLSYTYQSVEYGGDDWLYAVTRADEYANLTVGWNYIMSKNSQVTGSASFVHNYSNIELYQFEREIISISFKYEY